jgi:hypothetical protein
MVSLTAALKYKWPEPSACFGGRSTVHLYCGCRRLAPTNGQVSRPWRPSRSLVHLIKRYDSCCRLAITAPTGGQGEPIARPSIIAERFFCCLTDAIGGCRSEPSKEWDLHVGLWFDDDNRQTDVIFPRTDAMPFLLPFDWCQRVNFWMGTTVWCASTRRRGQSLLRLNPSRFE